MQLPITLGLILTITLFIAPTRAELTCNNGGQLYCCQAAVAGDTKFIQFAADLVEYKLDPNDVSCILSEPIWTRHAHCWLTIVIARSASEDCPGVPACCQKPLVRQKQHT